MLILKEESNWRSDRSNGNWFTARNTSAGTCTLDVIDPVDADLADDDGDPVVLVGIGNRGPAEQRITVTVDPHKQPLGCLRSTVAAGDSIDMQNDTLRASGLITAAQVTANAASVYGDVEALSVSGSTYYGTTTQIAAGQRPDMPDWQTVFDYYRNNGAQININDLPSATPNLGTNVSIENGTTDWTGAAPVTGTAQISQNNSIYRSGANSLRVQNRQFWYSGASQAIDKFVKPGAQYNVEAWVYQTEGATRSFHVTLYTKGSGNASPLISTGPAAVVPFGFANIWLTKVSGTLTAQAWSGNLEYAFVKIGSSDSSHTSDFYLDDLDIRENTTGRFIYRQVLSPGVNPFGGGTTNSQGIYWIDCGGQRLIIERSRILGTLLVVNPGANSCVADGPIHWSPYVAGYPALLVDANTATDADFSIRATNQSLSEKDNGVNYNPSGSPHSEFGQDADTSDIYRSEITGLIAIEDDLTFQNTPLIRGQVIVGDDIANSSGALDVEYQPDSLFNPPPGFLAPKRYERRPASATKAVLP
jgi:hypothetical protein